jgi:hypothetical protein
VLFAHFDDDADGQQHEYGDHCELHGGHTVLSSMYGLSIQQIRFAVKVLVAIGCKNLQSKKSISKASSECRSESLARGEPYEGQASHALS